MSGVKRGLGLLPGSFPAPPARTLAHLFVLRGAQVKGILVDVAVVARLGLNLRLVVDVLRPAALQSVHSAPRKRTGVRQGEEAADALLARLALTWRGVPVRKL